MGRGRGGGREGWRTGNNAVVARTRMSTRAALSCRGVINILSAERRWAQLRWPTGAGAAGSGRWFESEFIFWCQAVKGGSGGQACE